MAQQTLAERLAEARGKVAEQQTIIADLRAKVEAGTWKRETDKPALDAAIEASKQAEGDVETITTLINEERVSSAYTTTATTASPVTVNLIKEGRMGDDHEKIKNEFRITSAIGQFAQRGRLDGLPAEVDQEGKKDARALNLDGAGTGDFTLPAFMVSKRTGREARDITATTTTTGGHTIATELQSLIPFLDPRLAVMEMGATYLPGMTGNLDFPRNDAAATAVWASAENTTSTETTPTFDKLSLTPKRITAFTDVSKQNLLQTSIAMENFVRNRLNRAAMNLLETACISGSGSSGQPTGIMTIAGTNDITIGTNGGPLTWALTVQFETETAIDNADMGRLGYLFTPGVAGVLKTTKRDVAGSGFIWEGPNGDALVNGYRAKATNFLSSTLTKGTSSGVCHAAIFGNWEELMIAQWGGIDLMLNPYTKAKEAQVEVILHAWYDLGIRHVLSFCKCDEITLS